MTALWIAVGVLTVAILFLGFALAGAVRRIDELRREARAGVARDDVAHPASGSPVGAAAPAIDAEGIDGEPFGSASLRGRRHLVVFAEPGCAACHDLIPELVRASELPPTIVVSVPGEVPWPEAWRPRSDAPWMSVVRDPDGAIAQAYDTGFTPHAFVVDEAGWVAAQGPAASLNDVRQLLREAETIRIVHAEPGGG